MSLSFFSYDWLRLVRFPVSLVSVDVVPLPEEAVHSVYPGRRVTHFGHPVAVSLMLMVAELLHPKDVPGPQGGDQIVELVLVAAAGVVGPAARAQAAGAALLALQGAHA